MKKKLIFFLFFLILLLKNLCPNYKDSVAGCLLKTYKFLFIAKRKQLLFRALLKSFLWEISTRRILQALKKLWKPSIFYDRERDMRTRRLRGTTEGETNIITDLLFEFSDVVPVVKSLQSNWRGFTALFWKKWIKIWESLSDQIRDHIQKNLFLI